MREPLLKGFVSGVVVPCGFDAKLKEKIKRLAQLHKGLAAVSNTDMAQASPET